MMRYQGALSVDATARSYWRTIAVSVLTFLQYFHTRCRKVHMDIKCPNILVERPRMRFVVSDYDLAGTIRPDKVTCSYRPDTCWYYVAMGAELDKPLYSWRMDLTALGYMLAAITWEEDDNGNWKFYDECMLRRNGRHGLDISDNDLIKMRDSEMTQIHLTVRTYLNMVAARVGWCDVEPPSKEFYGELLSLFC
jgi:serine/threonine protein kinase